MLQIDEAPVRHEYLVVPWKELLAGAGGAGVVLGVVILMAKRIFEKAVDTRFDQRLTELKARLAEELESHKSELAVWAQLRNEVLIDVWQAHRAIVREMTRLILRTQRIKPDEPLGDSEQAIATVAAYRRVVHAKIDLLTPEATTICQEFLEHAYMIYLGEAQPMDGNELKKGRSRFYQAMASHFGLERMMPWMVRGEGVADSSVARELQKQA